MPAKRKQREPCKDCIARERPCEGLYPECEYYRRSVPTKAALAAEEASGTKPHRFFLEQYVKKLEEKYERLAEEASSMSNLSVRDVSKSPSPVAEIPPQPFYPRPIEMSTTRWWEADNLSPPIRDYLVGITLAYAHEEHLYFHHPSFLESLLEPIDSPRGPHRALLEAMYLVACYYTSVKFPNPTSPYSLERLEQHFLIRARKAQNDSLAWGDRLMDWLKGACLVTSYFTKKGRYLEGYHHHCAASRMALSYGLQHIVSPFLSPNVTPGQPSILGEPDSSILLRSPANHIELADRILCFWGIYLKDKVLSIVTGLPPALNDDQDGIIAALPRPAVEYETNDLRAEDVENLRDVFDAEPRRDKRPDSHFTSYVKGIALYGRARAMITIEHRYPDRVSQRDFATLHRAIQQFLSTLSPVRDAADEGLPFWSSIVSAHTFGLGALLELKTKLTQGEIIEGAKKMSHLVARMPEQQGLAGYCVYGHCWAAAAEVLISHQQSLIAARAKDEDITEVNRYISRLLVATKKLSGAFPKFAQQVNQVQQLLEMSVIS